MLIAWFALPAPAQSIARPSHPQRAAQFEAMRQRDENGVIATNGLINAIQQAQQMNYDATVWPGGDTPVVFKSGPRPKIAGLSTNNWEWLGPGNIGGRIRAIVIHPTVPTTMWVGGVGGGVWKSTNGAASFFPCNDWMANLSVCSLTLDPTDPNTLYAGTGEGFGNADAIRGNGIFKTADGGNTWTQFTTYATQNNINRLSICPTNHLILLAATGNGIWRSTNGGTNWTQTYSAASVKQLAFHPTNGSQAIATPDGTALYSTDGGQTWTSATGLGAGGRIEFAYALSSPNIVYASQNTNEGSLYVSTDGGVTYTLRNTGTNYLEAQGWYGNCIWVDPTNPNNLVVGGIDTWRSMDGGNTLTPISDWVYNQSKQLNDVNASAHADHHALVGAPGFDGVSVTALYDGNDGGLVVATNIYTVTTTNGWNNLNHNLGITQPFGIAANPTTLTTIIGSQDNGSTRFTTVGGVNGWHLWSGGDGGFCAADPTDPNYFYGEYVNLQIYRSTDGAQTSSYIYGGSLTDAGIADAGVPDGYDDDDPNAPTAANFIAPFILDPNYASTMLAGGSNLWRTVNVKAATPAWTNIKTGIASGSFISAIAVAPGNSDIIWVGHNDGSVYATTNGTSATPTWVQKDLGSPNLPNRYCNRLAIDPTNPNIVYAAFGGFSADNLYRTSDGGTTWTNLAGSLPAAPIYSIVIASFNHNYIYVGTEVGVFGSANAGASWSTANEGPANVQVLELAWARNYLLAATHGRGAYRLALGPPTVAVTPVTVTTTTGQNVTFTATPIGAPTLTVQWQYDGSNIAGTTGSTLTLTNLQTTNSGRYTITVSNGQGAASATATLTVIEPPPYQNQTAATGPTAYYRLNETSGTTAYDVIAGNNGTNNGSIVLGVTGPTPTAVPGFESGNTAYSFSGSGTSVSLPALNLTSNITLTAWVQPAAAQSANYPGVVSWSGGGNTISLGFGNGNNRLTYVRNGSVYSSSSLVVPTNQWTFIALALSPTNAVLYMATNSSLIGYNTGTTNPALTSFTSTGYLGKNPYASYNGSIDEVGIYNQLLTPAQLTNLVAAATTALPTVTLTAPADGSGYLAPATINLTASVVTNGHSIQKVQFYNSASLLAESTTPPYAYTYSSAPHGLYTFLAKVVYDGGNALSSLPVNVSVTNLPPIAVADATNTVKNAAVTINVLANDSDPNGYVLTVQSVTPPSNGSTAIVGTNILYTPTTGFTGTDTFSYTCFDGHFDTASATVTVTVNQPSPPNLVNDTATTTQNTSVTIPVLANDTDPYNLPLAIQSITQPTRGSAAIAGTNVVYTPNNYWYGLDTFTYTANDDYGPNATATVSVTTPYTNYPSTFTNAVLSAGPVAYWRLNETSGTTAHDSVGSYNGTNNGSLVFAVSGPTPPAFPGFESGNTAYQFNGTNTSVSIPALNLNTNTVTVTAWVKCNGTEGYYPGIFTWAGTGINRGQFLFGNSNNAVGLYWNGNFQVSSLIVPGNQWTFVALVISPTNSVIYMATNSTLASWTNGTANTVAAFNGPAYLGNSPYSRYNGAMDEVAIFNQSLTGSEISGLLAAALTGLPAVALTAPTNGSIFSSASNITLTASVTTNGYHTVEKVQFFTNATLLAESGTAPYQFNWSGAPSGSYAVTAKLLYDGGSILSSAAANITVTNAATVATNPTNILATISGTNLVLSWPGDHTGWTLQAQTNSLATGLGTNWVDVPGSTSVNAVTNVIIPTNGSVFYRLQYTP